MSKVTIINKGKSTQYEYEPFKDKAAFDPSKLESDIASNKKSIGSVDSKVTKLTKRVETLENKEVTPDE